MGIVTGDCSQSQCNASTMRMSGPLGNGARGGHRRIVCALTWNRRRRFSKGSPRRSAMFRKLR